MTVQPTQGGANTVAAGRLWAGGLATAVVAGLVAIVGILLARGVFGLPVLAPEEKGIWGDADTATYALWAALAAVLATGVLHMLLLSTPRPLQFFGWIVALTTIAAALVPVVASGSTSSKIATGLINVAVGITIGSLLPGAARSAVRLRPAAR
jgi:hypothetical protein